MKILLSLWTLCVVINVNAQIDLKYDLKQGQTFKILTVLDQKIEQEMMGQSIETVQKITFGTDYKVISTNPEYYDVKCTYYRVGYFVSATGMEISYDSETDTETTNPATAPFAAMLNKSFSMHLTPSGQVLKVKGVDQLLDDIVNSVELPEDKKTQLKTQLSSQFGEKSQMKSQEQVFKFFPETGRASKGDQWTYNTTLASYDIDMVNSYTLKSYDPSKAEIEVMSEMLPGSFTQMSNGMEVEMTLGGKQLGTFFVDRDSGMIRQGVINQDLKGEATMMGMNVPMVIKSESTFTRED